MGECVSVWGCSLVPRPLPACQCWKWPGDEARGGVSVKIWREEKAGVQSEDLGKERRMATKEEEIGAVKTNPEYVPKVETWETELN